MSQSFNPLNSFKKPWEFLVGMKREWFRPSSRWDGFKWFHENISSLIYEADSWALPRHKIVENFGAKWRRKIIFTSFSNKPSNYIFIVVLSGFSFFKWLKEIPSFHLILSTMHLIPEIMLQVNKLQQGTNIVPSHNVKLLRFSSWFAFVELCRWEVNLHP